MSAVVDEAQLDGLDGQDLVAWAYAVFDSVVLVSSFQAESVVLLHMATRAVNRPLVLTIDTGRLPEATHTYIDQLRECLDFELQVAYPDPVDVGTLVEAHGMNPFRRSVELRHHCCEVRKVWPLRRALRGHDAWVTGLRRDQSASRRATPRLMVDAAHGGIAKLAPLVTWTRADVMAYLEANRLPPHPLYGQGYASIGCAPCTRGVEPGDDERAGRWWWEQDAVKECGLHWSPAT